LLTNEKYINIMSRESICFILNEKMFVIVIKIGKYQ
jgi:hypothetical protein